MEIHSVLPLFISFILLCSSSGSLGQGLAPTGSESNYTTERTFQSNLNILLTDLVMNAMQNTFFYNGTYGKAPDQVYGLAMCYDDASPSDCGNCLYGTSFRITKGYYSFKKTAVRWNDSCMIRYSDEALKATDNIGLLVCERKVSDRKPEILNEPKIFRYTLQQLFDGLSTSASRSPLRMAAKKMNYTSNATIYALAQCTRQLSSNECRMCISNLTDFGIDSCTDETVEADQTFKTVSCYARFALHPFYVFSLGHPPWSYSSISKSSKKPIPTHMLTIIVSGLWVLVARRHC